MKTISDQSIVNRIKKPKTRRGKRVLERREPQLVETVKKAVFCRSTTASQQGVQLLKEFAALKKPDAIFFNRKEQWKPFENVADVEFITSKNDCPLFGYVTDSKKRPNNLILARTFDGHVLDMAEFEFKNFKQMADFKGPKISTSTKPIVLFSGQKFESSPEYQRLKSMLLDFFVGQKVDRLNLHGLEHVIQFTVVEDTIYMRSYRVLMKKSPGVVHLPRVELEPIGPNVDFTLRRSNFASEDLFKKSLQQSEQILKQQGKMKKAGSKNISKDAFGSKLGRIHMERQDYSKLRLRKGGAFKATTSAN